MEMRRFYILILAAVALLAGCDSVGSDERLIEIPPATVQRNVLIEDFTGQRCIFCPAASQTIEELQKLYGADRLIAVGIHAGPLAIKSMGGVKGLRTDAGDVYYKYWAVPNVPESHYQSSWGRPSERYLGWSYLRRVRSNNYNQYSPSMSV